MPLYAYRCQNCGHEFEQRQRMSENPLTDCPQCQQVSLRRVINQVGIVFRGSGFYVTDTKSNNPAAPGTVADKNGAPATADAPASATPTAEATPSTAAPASKPSTESSAAAPKTAAPAAKS